MFTPAQCAAPVRAYASLCTAALLVSLAGCATVLPPAANDRLMGGQQGVAGASIQLYAVGTTGDGSAATPLLQPALTTDANGYFSLFGNFTCPAPDTMTYLIATGGNPGLGNAAVNPNLQMMAAIGRCDAALKYNPLTVNEVTTVAAVAALKPFMMSATHVGSTTAHAASLEFSFFNASEMASLQDGTSPGLYLSPGDLAPFTVINTLADVISTCINSSGGRVNDGSGCGTLFALVPPMTGGSIGGGTQTTIDALLSLTATPTINTVALFDLVPPKAPFQPQLALPPLDFAIGVYHVPSVQLLPAAGLIYANQPVGSTSAAQAVTIYNNGTTTATVTAVGIAGANASDFAVNGACALPLVPGSSCSLRVLFNPTVTGRRTAYLAVKTSGTPSDPFALSLRGTGN